MNDGDKLARALEHVVCKHLSQALGNREFLDGLKESLLDAAVPVLDVTVADTLAHLSVINISFKMVEGVWVHGAVKFWCADEPLPTR